MMFDRSFSSIVYLTLLALAAAGCAASRAPESAVADRQAVERAVMSYYERHATEENRSCLSPFMYGVTRVDMVESNPDRLVVDLGYLYRDRNRDDTDGFGRECTRYAERRFMLRDTGAGLEVVEMSGPQRAGGTA